MARFVSDGVELDFVDQGAGPLVVLIHGFASNKTVNWINTSWTRTITESGRRVVALDNRGHGGSEKLYHRDAYLTTTMARDVINLLDHLAEPRAVLMGYSMGARIAAFAALAAPDRLSGLVISGLAKNLVDGVPGGEAVAQAMEAPSAAAVTNLEARAFRVFAEQTGGDRRALAACIRSSRQTVSEAEIALIAVPTLVVAGSKDQIAGSADALAAMIPGSRAVTLEGRDHMTAVGDKGHKAAVLEFLDSIGV